MPSCYVAKADFRWLPYDDGSISAVVLDPPYAHHPGHHRLAVHQYAGSTCHGMDHAAVIRLYADGMAEARRVLAGRGLLMVKCADEIESSCQRRSHIEIFNLALSLGFADRDCHILVRDRSVSPSRWERQLHARRNESFLWIFEKKRS